jgi:hypothetical protein
MVGVALAAALYMQASDDGAATAAAQVAARAAEDAMDAARRLDKACRSARWGVQMAKADRELLQGMRARMLTMGDQSDATKLEQILDAGREPADLASDLADACGGSVAP